MNTSRLLLTIIASSTLSTSTLAAQETPSPIRGWTFGATGFGIWWTDQAAAFDVAAGPALQLGYITQDGVGFDFRGGYGGVGVVLRLGGRFGIQGDLLASYLQTGDGGVFAPSAALGLVLLPR